MNRWVGKVAVVTGASAGIGLAITKSLVREGMIVVGLARRKIKMESEMESLKEKGTFHALECDVSKQEDVIKTFDWIKKNLGVVHVLVNNAGVLATGKILDSNKETWEKLFGVNVMGLLYCSQEAVKSMKESGQEGHLININSVTGHKLISNPGIFINVYGATKYAVTSLTESLELELIGSKIRTTSISPGYVHTDITKTTTISDPKILEVLKDPGLEAEDIADSVVYVLGTPPRVQVTELIIKPVGGLL
ncbi:farnesol dehydrogenase-like [Belonocnema kinseyi]|uniref:farnesol dehydrogenase-like n=1 Tax=Belonocnema kinseyi TaxID=2817044 RepID=UPI00143CD507|nr:farnesol dehydrogenase-like [Belonocnema kinseyi]